MSPLATWAGDGGVGSRMSPLVNPGLLGQGGAVQGMPQVQAGIPTQSAPSKPSNQPPSPAQPLPLATFPLTRSSLATAPPDRSANTRPWELANSVGLQRWVGARGRDEGGVR